MAQRDKSGRKDRRRKNQPNRDYGQAWYEEVYRQNRHKTSSFGGEILYDFQSNPRSRHSFEEETFKLYGYEHADQIQE